MVPCVRQVKQSVSHGLLQLKTASLCLKLMPEVTLEGNGDAQNGTSLETRSLFVMPHCSLLHRVSEVKPGGGKQPAVETAACMWLN